MSDEFKIELTGDTKPFDSAVDSSMSRAENIIKVKLEKPIDSAMNKARKGMKDGLEAPLRNAGDEAESFGASFSKAFVGGLALPNLASGVYLAEKAIQALSYAGDEFFNVFKGEKLNKIEKQFDAMAASFDISGDIANAFNSRAGGLFEDDQMMQTLTEKMLTFEGKVEKMPDLFTAARKAANLFGGDAMDVFEKLSFAAQTGNTRSLRFIFPKLNLDKEVEKYAQSQNKLVGELSQTEIQQIRLNTILTEADKKLKNVAVESGSAAEGWQRLKIALGDVADETSKATAKASGGFFSTFFNGMADMIKGGPKAIAEIKSMSDAMENQAMVTRELKFLENDLAEYRKTTAGKIRGDDPYTVQKIAGLKALNAQYDEYIKKQKAIENVKGPVEGPSKPSVGYYNAMDEINKGLRDKLEQARVSTLNAQFSAKKDLENFNLLAAEKEKQNEMQLASDKIAILKEYQTKAIINEQQFEAYKKQIRESGRTDNSSINQSLLLADQAFQQKKIENAKWAEEQRKELQRNADEKALAAQVNFSESWMGSFKGFSGLVMMHVKDLNKNFTKTMAQTAATAYDGMVGGIGGAIKNMTLAFRNGQDGLQAFGEAFLATMGDMMVQMGTSFISMAIPMMILSDPRGGPLLAAGAGLIVAGTLLSASVGNGSTQGLGGTTGNAGGGVSGGTVDPGTTKAYRPDDLAEVKQQPKIEVNFAGNLLNNKESALYIAEVLQDAAFSNDIKFAGV